MKRRHLLLACLSLSFLSPISAEVVTIYGYGTANTNWINVNVLKWVTNEGEVKKVTVREMRQADPEGIAAAQNVFSRNVMRVYKGGTLRAGQGLQYSGNPFEFLTKVGSVTTNRISPNYVEYSAQVDLDTISTDRDIATLKFNIVSDIPFDSSDSVRLQAYYSSIFNKTMTELFNQFSTSNPDFKAITFSILHIEQKLTATLVPTKVIYLIKKIE